MNEPSSRTRKVRQAAFYYVLVAVLYDGAVWQFQRHGLLGERTAAGPVWFFLFLGAFIAAVAFYFLWFKENRWVARLFAVLSAGRLVHLIPDAFLRVNYEPAGGAPYAVSRAFYIAAFVVVALNAWLMARAGWDL